jgi:ATP-dependent Lon protease
MNEKNQSKSVHVAEATLPLLPLKNLVALPKSIIPVIVGRSISIKAIEYAMKKNQEVFVSTHKSPNIENPLLKDIFSVGTRAKILQLVKAPGGSLKILIEGICRAKINNQVDENSHEFIIVSYKDMVPVKFENSIENTALKRNLYSLFCDYAKYDNKISNDIISLLKEVEDFDYFIDTIAIQVQLSFYNRQEILEEVDLKNRSLLLMKFLKKEIEILKVEKKIKEKVSRQVEKHQKDYYLNEQMRAIQHELGKDDYQKEIDKLRKKAKQKSLSKEAMEKVEAELKRLEQMTQASPEASIIRNYVEWLISIPWKDKSKDSITIEEAERILNTSHAGMEKAKERIIEFLAAKKFAGNALKKSPIICLSGPPGVGKTSLAKSIASALQREMVRISLGGMRDEAEIQGHRRTYIGAMPGKIIQAMKKINVVNPVIVLDEIDKMSMDFRGDPASALLEVLDPEQNKFFADYFLEVDYDLSNIFFVTTANVIDNIPYPLLDRMEIIHLSGYTEKEKLTIAKKFLLPKLLKEYAVQPSQIKISDTIIDYVIANYTKEAGVRQLERVLSKLIRKTIQTLLKKKNITTVTVTQKILNFWLGVAPYKKDIILDKKKRIGLATGLAWTEVGGDTLEIEVTILKGKGALTLTGQLGEVMQESAQAAMSYIRSKAKSLKLKEDFYSELDIHIHIPEGAIPKDGPSAGITIATAVISALTKIPTEKNTALTGEVTLRGRVLPVGGLKEKFLAAIRFGIKKVIVSKANQDEIKEFEKVLEKKLKIIYTSSMDEVIKYALVGTI